MTFEVFNLDGKVALISGGSRGIGLGMARGLAQAGAAVAVWAPDPDENAFARRELESLGARVHTSVCDVTDPSAVEASMAETVLALGRVDACFANAGIVGQVLPFVERDLESLREVMHVNLEGAFLTLQAAARQMVLQGDGGSLVGMSSLAARLGTPKNQAYAASKAALSAMIRGCAIEFARHGIRANSLLPGWIQSDMTKGAFATDTMRERVLSRIPMRAWGTPADLAGLAVYLASDASRYHTGDEITIDGGYGIS